MYAEHFVDLETEGEVSRNCLVIVKARHLYLSILKHTYIPSDTIKSKSN